MRYERYWERSTSVVKPSTVMAVRGASVAGYNTGTIGVVLMGNFEVAAPLDVQLLRILAVGTACVKPAVR